MSYLTRHCFRTVPHTVRSGVSLGFALVLIYSSSFALYAIVRSSYQIFAALPWAEGLVGTLVANAFALIVSILFFALLFGMGAAVLQSVTLLLIYGVAALLAARRSPRVMAWIGLITSGLLAGVIQVAVQRSLGSYFAALWPTGYFFWLGLPSLLFVWATTWISGRVADYRVSSQTRLIGAIARE